MSVTDGSPNLRIRRYQDADHDAVWTLHSHALEHVGAHAGAGPWDDDLHAVRRFYLEQRGEFVVGLLEDQHRRHGDHETGCEQRDRFS